MDMEKQAALEKIGALESALKDSLSANARLQSELENMQREYTLASSQVRMLMADRTYDSAAIQ